MRQEISYNSGVEPALVFVCMSCMHIHVIEIYIYIYVYQYIYQ